MKKLFVLLTFFINVSLSFSASSLSQAEKDEVVSKHNQLRSSESGTDLLKMVKSLLNLSLVKLLNLYYFDNFI